MIGGNQNTINDGDYNGILGNTNYVEGSGNLTDSNLTPMLEMVTSSVEIATKHTETGMPSREAVTIWLEMRTE